MISIRTTSLLASYLIAASLGIVEVTAAHAQTTSPSFDCVTAGKADEVTICSNDQLAENDKLTTAAFGQAKQLNRKAAVATAKSFLRKRSACGSDVDCIAKAQSQALLDFDALGATVSASGSTGTVSAPIAVEATKTGRVKPSPAAQQVPPNPWPDAFARRDFKLGMSLQEFKRTPFPDKDKDAGAFSVCSDEARSKDSGYETAQLFSDVFQKSGMIKCAFFFTDSDTSMVFDAGLGLADTMVSTEFYFLPDDSLTPRLFWIQTSGPADMAGVLVPVMVKAYGEPQHTVEVWQNQAGGKFDNDVYVWTSPSSQITLKHFGSRNTVFDLKHTLKPLDEKFARILDQQNVEAAKKL